MENYLYFAAADVNTGGSTAAREGLCVPASSYIGADPVSLLITSFFFNSVEGTDGGVIRVNLTHTSGNNKAVIKAFMAAMNANPHSGGFVVMADSDVAGASKDSVYSNVFTGLGVTTVAITEESTQAVLTATHGAGAIGTSSFGAPQTRRWTENGVIVTEIKVDLTGLTAHGATANDVIGIKAAAPNAYLIQNTVADMGIIFRTEMSCLELPAGAGSLVDINLVWASSGTLGYSEAGGTTYGINGGTSAAGKTVVEEATLPTADHYAYLTEGTTDGDDSVFTAGQFLIRFYGHPVLA